MDIQKEREAFEKLPAVAELIKTNNVWWSDVHGDYFGSDHELVCWIDGAWAVWQAKAQAVPEGLVLVKKVHPDAIVHNQGLGLFKECQVIYGWDGKSKDFKDALNKGFYHGVKLGAKAVLETAMIEAQEQTNDK
ncbi:hypothetical protein [Acinetobacter indicus]|uniref:hypothetical protein n=1 Tax=Acinetobacter indicus TaxID=756892 RepID=UPI0032B56897